MYQRLDECPVCQGIELTNDRIIKDHSISGESFALNRCESCNFLFTNPRPAPQDLGKYYESEDYVSHTDEGNNLVNRIYKIVRSYTLENKVKLLSKHCTKEETLLDIGCGTGHFLARAKEKQWAITGVEPNPQARILAEKRLSADVFEDVFDVEAKKQFDAITLWHVLEHLPNLNETFAQFRNLTTKKGRIFIAVPNAASWDAAHYGEHWAAYDVPRHLYHFTQPTFKQLAKRHGFSVTAVHPMIFDSYYVSMLSEKYKTGKSNYISAFRSGRKSNAWAKKNKNNYSSLIYIIRKK